MEAVVKAMPSVRMIGVGGAGVNAVTALEGTWPVPMNAIVMDTDLQTLSRYQGTQVLLGSHMTRGLSTGGDAVLGMQVAEADRQKLSDAVRGHDLIFLVGGLGAGTGSGVMPLMSELAASEGALVIAFVLMPFAIEGQRKWEQADAALRKLRNRADAVVVLPNDLLLQQVDAGATVLDAFKLAHTWIHRAVTAITQVIFKPGFINLDFATLRQLFTQKGEKTLFALGQGQGEGYVEKALQELLVCPLMHTMEHVRSADNILINLIGGEDMSLTTVNTVLSFVNEHFGNKNKTCLGAVLEPGRTQFLEICVMGTLELQASLRGKGTMKHFTDAPAEKPSNVQVRSTKIFRKLTAQSDTQGEFNFVSRGQMRGYFDETDRNHCDGEDLDVPTYLRKGIKIAL